MGETIDAGASCGLRTSVHSGPAGSFNTPLTVANLIYGNGLIRSSNTFSSSSPWGSSRFQKGPPPPEYSSGGGYPIGTIDES
jgi:hypothetical protein